MNQLLTVNTRFGTSTALFNTIHKRLITVMHGDEDVTTSLQEWERNSLQQDLANGFGYTQTFKAARVVSTGFGTFIFHCAGETVKAAVSKWLCRSQDGWPKHDRIRIQPTRQAQPFELSKIVSGTPTSSIKPVTTNSVSS